MEATDEETKFRLLREAMVEHQLRDRDIRDPRVLRAMAKIPRHLFVPRELCWRAYEDRPLPIGEGQTISQPYMVAKMIEALMLTGTERVLDVGTGSGYQAAVLAELAREVWSVEIIPYLAKIARSRLQDFGYTNVHVVTGDGSLGLPEHAPYDAVVVAAAASHTPEPLMDQLTPAGRLVIPVGGSDGQMLKRLSRQASRARTDSLLPCVFVPLTGELGSSDTSVAAATR